MSLYEFVDELGRVIRSGRLRAVGGTVGDVPTQQADHSLSQAAGGGSLPGATRIIDLGVVTMADLVDGQQVRYTPAAAGEFFQLMYDPVTFVARDGQDLDVLIGQDIATIDFPPANYLIRVATGADTSNITDTFHGGAFVLGDADASTVALFPSLPTDSPIVALITAADKDNLTINVVTAPPLWQAGHAYADNALVMLTDGNLLNALNAGTSDASEPTYPGYQTPVVDNDINWQGALTRSTVGEMHFYALVGTPAAP